MPALDPDAVWDYREDWNPTTDPWLESGETIAEVSVAVYDRTGAVSAALGVGDGVAVVSTPSGNVTPAAPAISGGTIVVVWLYVLTAVSSEVYTISITVRTSSARTKTKSFLVAVLRT